LVALLGAYVAEEVEHAGVRRLEAADAVEVGLGRRGLAAHAPVDHRDLDEGADLLRGLEAARAELILVERDELVPRLRGGVRLREEGEGVGVARREREHLLVRGRRAGRVAEPPRGRVREAQPARDAILLLRRV